MRESEECTSSMVGMCLSFPGAVVFLCIVCSCQDQRITQRQEKENSCGLRVPGTARSCWRLKGEGETKILCSVTQKTR